MSKLTKAQAKAHQQACDLIASDRPLTDDEKEFVARNWNEAATHVNTTTGAHFTPVDMALDFSWDVYGPRVLDLCAGIGVLGLACVWRQRVDEAQLVCVELNPDYVAVGKRLLPRATWICADALTPDRTSAPWWQAFALTADAVLFVNGRIKFVRPDGSTGGKPSNGTTLFARGARAVEALKRAEANGLGLVLR
jgi:hypothetical protein